MNNYICYIGRPSYQKNPYFFVEVVKKVHEVSPTIKFKILGVGYFSPDLEQTKKMIDKYGLNDTIELLPWLNHQETLKYINDSLFYVTVSRYEGLPLAVIEAMSLSKPIIASDVLGNKDCVIHNYNGFLLPLSVDLFVEKIIELINDDNKRKSFSTHSRQLFLEKFFIENRIKDLEDIYLSIANTNK